MALIWTPKTWRGSQTVMMARLRRARGATYSSTSRRRRRPASLPAVELAVKVRFRHTGMVSSPYVVVVVDAVDVVLVVDPAASVDVVVDVVAVVE